VSIIVFTLLISFNHFTQWSNFIEKIDLKEVQILKKLRGNKGIQSWTMIVEDRKIYFKIYKKKLARKQRLENFDFL